MKITISISFHFTIEKKYCTNWHRNYTARNIKSLLILLDTSIQFNVEIFTLDMSV